MKQGDFQPPYRKTLIALLLGAAFLRLLNLGTQSLWFDEIITWLRATLPFGQFLEFSRTNIVHPPLYFLLMRLVSYLGTDEFTLRFPSACLGIIGVASMYSLVRKLYGRKVGLVAAALLAVNPFHIWYSQEARMYALVFLESLFIGFYFLRGRGYETWGDGAGLLVFSAFAYVTHYFCLLLPLAQYFYILLKFRETHCLLRRWVLLQALAAIPIGTWVIFIALSPEKHMGIGWIPKPGLADLLLTLVNFGVTLPGHLDIWSGIAFIPFGISLAWAAWRNRDRAWWLSWLFIPPAVVLFISLTTGRHFYADRFFSICLPAFFLMLGWGAGSLPSLRWRRALIALLLLASLAGLLRMHLSPLFIREDWRGVCAFLQAQWRAGDLVVVDREAWRIPLHYYGCEFPVLVKESWEVKPGQRQGRVWIVCRNPYEWPHPPARPREFDILSDRMIDLGESKVRMHRHFIGIEVLLVD
ncbi:MAG: hypothetical protein DRI61_11230 [Chloroflexi bacterium]|nr:MAG: hypothetical protein DRI61_11230 [Chloroflexota bacterium]